MNARLSQPAVEKTGGPDRSENAIDIDVLLEKRAELVARIKDLPSIVFHIDGAIIALG